MTQTNILVAQRYLDEQPTIEQIQQLVKRELERYGFNHLQEVVASNLCNQQLRVDDFDGNQSFYGEWHDQQGRCLGSVLIHGGGQVYAELDILKQHPTNYKWFVESVTVWGRCPALKSDLSLLPALND